MKMDAGPTASLWRCLAAWRPKILASAILLMNIIWLPAIIVGHVSTETSSELSVISGFLGGMLFVVFGFGPIMSCRFRSIIFKDEVDFSEVKSGLLPLQFMGLAFVGCAIISLFI